jgi:hypothetical protein
MNQRAQLVCLLISALSWGGCAQGSANVAALIAVYEGPTDKYIPCLVLSQAAHSKDAVKRAERLGCRTFASLIATTEQPEFFRRVTSLGGSRAEGLTIDSRIRFVSLDSAGHDTDLYLDVISGLNAVRELSVYFPAISSRIEAEFIRRFPEGQTLATK